MNNKYGVHDRTTASDLPYGDLGNSMGYLGYAYKAGTVAVCDVVGCAVHGAEAHPIARAVLNVGGLLICRHNRITDDLWQCAGCNQVLLMETDHMCLTQQAIDTLAAIR